MHLYRLALAILTALLGLTVTVSASPRAIPQDNNASPSAAQLPPDQDPFYRPPEGFEQQAPGAILRSRPIVAGFLQIVPVPVAAWQLLFRTTAVNGSAIAAVTTVFKPLVGARLDRFVSFATAYDASATICNPSYAYSLGSGADINDHQTTYVEFLIMAGYLLQGYIVSSPDYEGLDAAFSPGHLEAHCVLDNMRAVTNFGRTLGFSVPTPAIVAHGYSGGAIATGWAAALQPSYAPELPVRGWAHGGTPANLTGTLTNIDGGAYAGYVPPSVVGLLSPTAYAEQLQPLFDGILTPRGEEAFAYARSHCAIDLLNTYANASFLSTDFQTLGPAILREPRLAEVLEDNIMGVDSSELPATPVLIYHSIEDQVIPYADASTLVDRYCSSGAASVTFTTFTRGGHVGTAAAGLPGVYAFVNNVFAGRPQPRCARNTVDLPVAIPQSLDFGAQTLQLAPILPGLASVMASGE